MMKKTIFLLGLFLMNMSVANINAQVRIGGDNPPNISAVLDLNPSETAYAAGGVLLPRVYLDSLTHKVFGINVPIADGLLVYNTRGGFSRPSEGIYFYSGSQEKWVLVQEDKPVVVGDDVVARVDDITARMNQLEAQLQNLIENGGGGTGGEPGDEPGDNTSCHGVVIPGGAHNGPTEMTIEQRVGYSELISNHNFTQNGKDLCVYYRDASEQQGWDNAMTNCQNGNNVDVADKTNGWRLPNAAELAQMQPGDGGSWSPEFDKLSESGNGINNLQTTIYWSSNTASDRGVQVNFSRLDSFYGAEKGMKLISRNVRCVKTMN
ncbi:MAG: DUF1566 domain-containing protein [Dysgonamonadaceae bacterium]|nr:DUF1566 domain-containing protein [Dysgonamonadaceae bacterium]